MDHHPSTENYRRTLPFSSFRGEASVANMPAWRASSKVLWRMEFPRGTTHLEASVEPIAKLRIESRHDTDDYGRPRILSKWEAVLHALAWPILIGVILGYGLSISLAVVHAAAGPERQAKSSQLPVEFLEDQS